MHYSTKVCKRCKQEKHINEFTKDKNRSDGIYPWCKMCHKEANRIYQEKMKARTIVDIPKRKLCKRCGVEKDSNQFYHDKRRKDGLYSSCKDCHYQRTRNWQLNNPDVASEIQQRSKEKHREKINANAREYYRANREVCNERSRRWRKNNPEKNREHARRYVARKLNATVEEVCYETIIERDDMVCHICGKRIRSRKDLHFDHIVPLSKGGEHSMRNVACAHAKCNLRKGDRDDIPVQTRLFGEV